MVRIKRYNKLWLFRISAAFFLIKMVLISWAVDNGTYVNFSEENQIRVSSEQNNALVQDVSSTHELFENEDDIENDGSLSTCCSSAYKCPHSILSSCNKTPVFYTQLISFTSCDLPPPGY